ncbi:MAG: S8 family serine peptidase [Bacteroidales bacterium]|nr:S8 family serine peptidase [Bacteroidales bacterium]
MIKKLYIAAIAAFAIFSCAKPEITEETAEAFANEEEAASKAIARRYVKGNVIVKFDDQMISLIEQDLVQGSIATKSAALNSVVSNLGIKSMTRVFPDAGEYEERTRREGLHRYYKVTFADDVVPTKAISDLAAVPGIESAEGILKVRRRAFNDPYLSRQWHYINNDYTKGADINVKPVWDSGITGNENVIVAVVDGGVALTHTDLSSNAVAAGANGSKNFVKNNYTIEIDEHGTHVAGTIAAINNNGKGVCGIAGGDYANNVKGCKVMSCQIFNEDEYDENNGSDATCANAIKWGADHGAVISQNSWGYYADDNDDGTVSNSEYNAYKKITVPSVIKSAISYFVKYAGCDNAGNQKAGSMMKGGIVFFAAGNEDIDLDPICQQCDVVAVGCFDQTGAKSYFSNYGSWVDIAAPGGEGSYTESHSIYSLAPNNKYAYMDGTSMACPHVSGVAALVVSKFGGDGFTNEMLKTRILEGASTTAISAKNIGPKVDAYGAITYSTHTENQPPVISIKSVVPAQIKAWQTIDVELEVSDPDGDALNVTVKGSGAEQIIINNKTYFLRIVGTAAAAGKYTATITVTDVKGESAEATCSYEILENHPPVVNKNFSNIISGSIGQIFSFNIEDYFTDPDEEPLSFKFNLSENRVAHLNVNDNTLYVTSLDYGLSDITVTATDALGKSVSSSFSILVRDGDTNEIDAYPNPVIKTLFVRTGEKETLSKVSVVSTTGSVVYEAQKTFSAFNPLQIDMSSVAPGIYTLKVSFDGKTQTKTVVKK